MGTARLLLMLSWDTVLLDALGSEKEAFKFSQLALFSTRSQLAQPDVNVMVHSFSSHIERPAAHKKNILKAA